MLDGIFHCGEILKEFQDKIIRICIQEMEKVQSSQQHGTELATREDMQDMYSEEQYKAAQDDAGME